MNVSNVFLESFLSLTLSAEGVPSVSACAFLLGVSRLNAPKPSGPGESLTGLLLESSSGDILQREGVVEQASLSRSGVDVRRQLNFTFFLLLLFMSEILIQQICIKYIK